MPSKIGCIATPSKSTEPKTTTSTRSIPCFDRNVSKCIEFRLSSRSNAYTGAHQHIPRVMLGRMQLSINRISDMSVWSNIGLGLWFLKYLTG